MKFYSFNDYILESEEKPLVGIICNCYYDKEDDSEKRYCDQDSFFIQMIEYGNSINAEVFVFSEKEFSDSGINGYTILNDEWIQKQFSIPKVVYNRDNMTSTSFRDKLKELGCKFLNPDKIVNFANDKLVMYKGLKDSDVNMPETEAFDSNKLMEFLDKNKLVYLKPISGSMGKGIIKITKDSISYDDEKKANWTVEDVNSVIEKYEYKPAEYLMQAGIDVQMYKDSVFDVRVLMQKNENGQTLLTGFESRCGEKGKITSNIHTGGHAEKTTNVIIKVFGKDRLDEILNEIRRLSWIIVKKISKDISRFGEIGIDFLIDKQGKVYLLELNTRPGRSIFKIEPEIRKRTVERPIDYCVYLTKN